MASGRRSGSWAVNADAASDPIAVQQMFQAAAPTLSTSPTDFSINTGAPSLQHSGSFKSVGSPATPNAVSELAANLARARAYEKAQRERAQAAKAAAATTTA